MKEFILPRAGDRDQRVSKFRMCDTQLNLSLFFQYYLVYGFSVKCKTLVSLGYLLLGHLRKKFIVFEPFYCLVDHSVIL